MPLRVSSTCAYHQEVKIALHSLWYHHTYRCDDTRGCVIQFWPPGVKHMCSKHVQAWSKLIVKQQFCASSWLITEINFTWTSIDNHQVQALKGNRRGSITNVSWFQLCFSSFCDILHNIRRLAAANFRLLPPNYIISLIWSSRDQPSLDCKGKR